MPDYREVCSAGEVLGDGDGGVEVEDDVPPAAWDKYRLPGLLNTLNGLISPGPVTGLGLGVDHVEPGDGLVPLLPSLAGLDCDQLLGSVGGEEAPSLVSGDQSVPSRSAERINVYSSARPGRSYHHPPVGRSLSLAAVLEEVVSEVFWKPIILQEFLSSRMVAVTAVEDIKRTVIFGIPDEENYYNFRDCLVSLINNLLHVIYIVFHFQFDAVAFIILPTFELLVPVFLSESL